MHLKVMMFNQDDPAKCTAAKLIKFGLASRIRRPTRQGIVLNPFAEEFILNSDKDLCDSVVAIDCSWEHASEVFLKKFRNTSRKLPPLLAGNPVNYAKIGKLTSVEAMAAALYIMGFDEMANSILNKFKWGHTFHDLNQDLLEEYSGAGSSKDMMMISQAYRLTA